MKQQQSLRYIKTVAGAVIQNPDPVQPISRPRIRLVISYFTAVFLLVLFAFTHTYFIHFPKFEKVTTAAHVHGIMMFAWFLLLIVQPFLIARGRYRLHRAIGKGTYLLVPLLLLSFIWVAAAGQQRSPDATFLFNSVPPLVIFPVFYLLAIRYKHRPGLHARYMMITPLVLYAPAVARIYQHYPALNAFPMFLITPLLLLGIMAYEWRHQRVYRPWLFTLAAHIITLAAFVFFLPSATWQKLANWFIAAVR